MNEPVVGYKLLLSYDVKEDSLEGYYQFVMGQYVPAVQSMGMQMSEAWHTAYGDAPNRLIGFVCRSRQTVDEVVNSETWQGLNDRLGEYVTDFSYKVLPYKQGFQF